MTEVKIRIPIINIEKIRAARANRELTRKMQILLSGIDSPYRRINWESVDQKIHSQSLPTAVATTVQKILEEAGVKCRTQKIENTDQSTIIINSSEENLDIQDILNQYRNKQLEEAEITEDVKELKEFVETISTSWKELSTTSEDLFNILRDAPPIIIELAEKLDELFIGMKSSTTKRSTSETAVLSTVYYSNLFLNLLTKATPDLVRFAFKKTPIGPIFIAGYQLASDAFYANKWIAGREQLHTAHYTSAEQVQLFAQMYESLYEIVIIRINTKQQQIKAITNFTDEEISNLVDNNQTELLNEHPPAARALYDEITELKTGLKNAENSTKELTKELRKKASRINTAQQVMMTTKHIDRIFNIGFIALGIASVFFPPLAIPATIIAIVKGATRKQLEDRIRTGTQIVQGIYDIDDNVVISNGKNRAAINKIKDLMKINLQYAPPALAGVKLGIRQQSTYDKTKQLIRSNPEYTLYLPGTFSYKQLGTNATRSQIRGQIDAYSDTCRQLIFHLGIIQGIDLNGNPTGEHIHPPYIHNINELKDLINAWSENLVQQIHDQQLNPPRFGRNSYFSDAQLKTIRELHFDAINYIENHQNRVEDLDRKEVDKDGKPIPLPYFDMKYAKKAHESILDEIVALRSILNNKKSEQQVKNATAIVERLEKRINLSMNYCDKCPYKPHQKTFRIWKDELESELRVIKKELEPAQSKKESRKKSVSEKQRGIEVEASDNQQVFLTVHHARGFESRKGLVNRLQKHIAEKKEGAEKDKKTELVLLPVAKISSKTLYHYKGNFWKMMWLVRGIDRALESVELTMKHKETIGAEINPKNQLALLNFYKEQLEKINNYRKSFTFSKSGQETVMKRVDNAIKKVDALILITQQQISRPSKT